MPGCDPVCPDFTLVLREHNEIIKIVPNLWWRVYGVPDLIGEVLLPDSVDYDEGVKLAAYANAGVPEYAVIDPPKRSLRLYTLNQPGQYHEPRAYSGYEMVTFACLPTISFRLSALFEGAPDTTL
jgi:Uma2 family endonuclease